MEVAVAFSSLNVIVLAGLLYVYARITRRSRALYPAGLLFFASFLLLQNLLTVYSYMAMTPFYGESLLPYLLAISVLEFGGLIALTRITL
jgi:hypothetical protein